MIIDNLDISRRIDSFRFIELQVTCLIPGDREYKDSNIKLLLIKLIENSLV